MYKLREYMSYKNCADFLQQIQAEIDESPINDFLSFSFNPLKIIILIIHMNSKLVKQFAFTKIQCDKISNKLIKYGLEIMNTVENQRDLKSPRHYL